jgi:RNA polymerase sigma-54 factor
MRLGYGMKLEQTQKLVMTPELRQAIKVLQLSAIDLAQYVENAMLENPLLEVTEEEHEEAPSKDEDDFNEEWCDYLAECGQIERSFEQAAGHEEKEHYSLEHFVAQTPSLQDHLYLQLRLTLSDPKDMEIGEFLIGNINDRGYFNIGLEEVQKISGFHIQEIERILKVIQSFDPPGVGARDLQECLLIQLDQHGQRTPVLEKIIRFYLDDLANGNLFKIASSTGLTVQEVQKQVDLIKLLDPIPGRNFYLPGENRYIVPDVVVEKVNGEYVIVVDDVAVPRLMINRNYQRMVKQKADCDQGTVEFIQNKMKAALWLIRSIEQRRLTLYKVVQCIIDYQRDFLEKGIKYLKPLNLKQIADMAELHESTFINKPIFRQIKMHQEPSPVHLINLFIFRYYYSTIAMRKVIIKNAPARPAVILLRNSSTPFFLPSSVWAPPAMAPDNPAAFPDCIRIVIMSPRQINTSKTIKMVLNKPLSPLY